MPAIPAAGTLSNPALTEGALKLALEDVAASLRHVPWSGQVELAHTIVSGVINPAGSGGVVVVDTEAAAPTDDLTSITTTFYPDGAFLMLRNADAARVVVVKHAVAGVGSIQLDRNADYALDDTRKWLLLRRHGADWYELRRGPARLTAEVLVKSATFTVSKADIGKVFICSNAYTVALGPAAGVGNGFIFGINNVGIGQIVLDPDGAELIDGASTLTVLPGWSYELVCTGTAWTTVASHGPAVTLNPIINAKLDFWQRGPSTGSVGGGSTARVGPDLWAIGSRLTSVNYTVLKSTNVPSLAQAGVLLQNAFELDVTTTYTPVPGDAVFVRAGVIGGDWRHFNRRQITVSFWVFSTKTGTHTLALRDFSGANTYLATYTVHVADTWEWKSMTIPASPNITSNSPAGYALQLAWTLMAGSNFTHASPNQWLSLASPGMYAATGQVNLFDNVANSFRITGVKMDVGASATPYDVESWDLEYLRCLQHVQKSFNLAQGANWNIGLNTGEFRFSSPVGASTQFDNIWIPFQTPVVGTPIAKLYSPSSGASQVRNITLGADCTGSVLQAQGKTGFHLVSTTPAGTNIGDILGVHWLAEASQ